MKALFAALIALLLSGTATAGMGQDIKVSVLKHDPSPAEAGKFLELWLSIENQGTGIVNDYTIELVPGYPFFLDSNEEPVRNFAFIDADGARAKYRLRVAEDAPNGDSILKVRQYRQGSQSFIKQDLEVSVLGKVDVDIVS